MILRVVLSILISGFVLGRGYADIVDTSSVSKTSNLTNKLSSYASYREADMTISSFMAKWGLTGASVAIMKDDRLVYAKGFGYADKELKVLTTPAHTFRVASISKLITAVAIMKLVEEGRISINDTVFGKNGILNDARYCKATDKRAYKITVKNLLMHEAGWNSRFGDQMFMQHYIAQNMHKKLPLSQETIIEFSLKKGLHYMPGTGSSYSNLGYCILGKIIEKVSGEPYETYVNKEILNPLNIYGMRITSNSYDRRGPMEVKYYDTPGAKKRMSIYGTNKLAPRTYEGTDFESLGAAGGWTASASQLMKLLAAIDGHAIAEDILSCNAIDSMTTLSHPTKFGYGWIHSDNNGNWWRTGTLSGSSAFMMRRCDGISYVFITNSSTWRGNKFAYDIKVMMENAVNRIGWWPSEDLFPYFTNSENSLSAAGQ